MSPTYDNSASLGGVRITASFIIWPGRGNILILGHLTLLEALGIDVMNQLKVRLEGDSQQDREGGAMEDTPQLAIRSVFPDLAGRNA